MDSDSKMAMFSEKQQDYVKTQLFDYLEFFGYFKNKRKEKELKDGQICKERFDYPKLFKELINKYQGALVDKYGGKKLIKHSEFLEVNEDSTKANARYKKEQRLKKKRELQGQIKI
mmetsp:Transcript_4774/g.8185  ORF Transcript_4774/g.8185 Transcript_4774/m.8185 type:complete len:116 (+) Transcript_4774:1143-1490(+)